MHYVAGDIKSDSGSIIVKVLILGSGKSYHATRWANALSERGIEVGFASVHEFERPLSDKVYRFQLSTKGYKGYFLDITRLKSVIKVWNPTILHAHFSTGYGFMARLSGFRKRIVSIYGSDIYEFPYKSIAHKNLLRFNLSGVSRVLSTSESMADEFLNVFPTKRRPIVTPFGVDVELFKPFHKSFNHGYFNIGIVKKMEIKYGVDILLKAVYKLKRMTDKKLKLNIVGIGSQQRNLEALAHSLNIQDITTFYGAIDNSEVPEFLSKQDVFVVPSRFESESFGVAAVEAQACAVPIIVSNVGGLPEVIEHGVTGLVVEKENPEKLANALLKIINNKQLRENFGKAGRERVQRLYDWKQNVSKMIDIYIELEHE